MRPSRHHPTLHSRWSLLLILLLIGLAYSQSPTATPKSTEPSQQSNNQLIQSESQVTRVDTSVQAPRNTTSADSDDESDEDLDSLFTVTGAIFWAEMSDANFYAGLLMSIIYNPLFGIGAFCLSAFGCCFLAAIYVAKFLVKIPRVAMTWVFAVGYIIFAGMTVYYIYTLKDQEMATEASAKKEGGGDETIDEEEERLVKRRRESRAPPEPPQTDNFLYRKFPLLKKVFNISFVRERPFRFLFAIAVMFVSYVANDALRKAVKYRKRNGFMKIFLSSLINIALCSVAIGLLGFLIKELLFRKYKISVDKTKKVKYFGCFLLALTGAISVVYEIFD